MVPFLYPDREGGLVRRIEFSLVRRLRSLRWYLNVFITEHLENRMTRTVLEGPYSRW